MHLITFGFGQWVEYNYNHKVNRLKNCIHIQYFTNVTSKFLQKPQVTHTKRHRYMGYYRQTNVINVMLDRDGEKMSKGDTVAVRQRMRAFQTDLSYGEEI